MAREPRVLVVSDDEETGGLVRVILAARGWAVACVANREVTLERLDIGRPDLVVLDMFTPVLQQWAIVEHLVRLPSTPAVIALTGRCVSPGALAALTLSVRGQLSKPFPPEELVELCERVLGAPRAHARETGEPERRSEERQTFVGEATLLTGKGRPTVEVRVVDVSPSGAQLEVGPLPDSVLAPGQRLRVVLALPPSFEPAERDVRVEWRQQERAGVSFLTEEPSRKPAAEGSSEADVRRLD